MDDLKFCFIICTNNSTLLDECMQYLNRLYIPEGYSTELRTVEGAVSMTSGYNEAMRSSDAKYKIYLHQDVFILNRYFLFDLLDIYRSDPCIGAVGLAGYKSLSSTGVMWESERYGAVPMYGESQSFTASDISGYRYSPADGLEAVACADGLLLSTCVDIEWDERFDGWDFYDVTQCMRIRNAGYRLVVPVQKVPWFIHDDGRYLTPWNYNRYRKLFLDLYPGCNISV